MEQPLNQGVQGVNPLFLVRLAAADFAPRVEKRIRGKQVTQPGVHPVTDNTQGVIDKQLRDIAPVAYAQLPPRIMGGGRRFTHRRFKLEHHQRQPVDIQDRIGDAGLGTAVAALALNLQLIHQPAAVAGAAGAGERHRTAPPAQLPACGYPATRYRDLFVQHHHA